MELLQRSWFRIGTPTNNQIQVFYCRLTFKQSVQVSGEHSLELGNTGVIGAEKGIKVTIIMMSIVAAELWWK
jgi:hypothetical protein